MKAQQDLQARRLAEEARRAACIKRLIDDLSREANVLDRDIAAVEASVGIGDPSHFAYPCDAKAAVLRRDNLRRSIEKLRWQVQGARAWYDER